MNTKNNQVIVMGDIHGEWGRISEFVNKRHPKLILQCGDFGYFPRLDRQEQAKYASRYKHFKPRSPGPKMQDTPLHFCPGNHEDFESLNTRETDELWPNVFYQPRGSVITLPDGRTVLFMGGAKSIDKERRTQGLDWFPDEEISMKDVEVLPDKVDIVISHTCPKEFPLKMRTGYGDKLNDWSQRALSHVLQVCRPSLWYFGHFHNYQTGYTMGCRWTMMDMAFGGAKWWEVLREK